MARRRARRNERSGARFGCRLLAMELAPFRRPGREGLEITRTARLRPGRVDLALSSSALSLARRKRELLHIPLRNLSRIEAFPLSVDAQLLTLLAGTFRFGTWFGGAKVVLFLMSTLWLMSDPKVQLPILLNHLPYFARHLAILATTGFFLDIPVRLLPGIWKIRGPMWRLRFEAMDGRAFNLLVALPERDRLIRLLRGAGLMVYPYPERLTLLDRGWIVRRSCESAVRRFYKEMF